MKRIAFVLMALTMVGGSAFAFDIMSFPPRVEGGDIMVDAGIGLRSIGYTGANWVIPPIFVQGEYALPVGVPISVGGMLALSRYQYKNQFDIYNSTTWSWTDITIAGRANWHWGFDIDWLDLYSGMAMGYTISRTGNTGSFNIGLTDYSGFYYAFQGGAHFYFTDFIGAMAEVGYPYWIKVGVALKF